MEAGNNLAHRHLRRKGVTYPDEVPRFGSCSHFRKLLCSTSDWFASSSI
jgi:hypothetical protein